jgi:hypothetical protein
MRARWLGSCWLVLSLVVGCGGGESASEPDVVFSIDITAADEISPIDLEESDLPDPADLVEVELATNDTVDPCTPNPCVTAPDPSCDADGVTLWTYGETGTCTVDAGSAICEYALTPVNCGAEMMACLDGECVEVEYDPCDPNPCLTAPDVECSEDGTTLTEFTAPGECEEVGGLPECTYEFNDTLCSENDQVCANGACVDPCDPNPCNEAPASECLDDGTEVLATFDAPGTCSYDGEIACDYDTILVDCADDDMVCAEATCLLEGEGNQPASAGQIIVSEFMAKSQSGSDKGEWMEVHNTTDGPLDLGGCILRDAGTDSHEILGPVVVATGGYAVLARSEDPADNHGLTPDYIYSGNSLKNTSDEIIVECGGEVIDELIYTSVLVNQGVAAQLDPQFLTGVGNDDLANWCVAVDEYGTAGKLGTPGGANPACPVPTPCLPNPCDTPDKDFCAEDGLTLNTFSAPGECTVDGQEALCLYVSTPVNCMDDGKVCMDGECVEPPPDPCDPNPCDAPPLPICNEAATAVTDHEVPGTCTAENFVASCEYTPVSVPCEVDVEICLDGKCVPVGAGVQPTEAGQFVITEFMAKSQGGADNGEWVELLNASDSPLDLAGCHMVDEGSDDKTIETMLVVQPDQSVVLARSADPVANHGLEPDYVYGGYSLGNADDEIILKCGELIIDQVNYAADQAVEGVAWQLSADLLDSTSNDDMANWCSASETYGTADKLGTPGAANLVCPLPDPCDPNPCDAPPADECDVDGLNLSDYPELGTCSSDNGAAVCDYPVAIINCADSDQKCEGGMCVSACDPNPCTNPPANECELDGITLTAYPAAGDCTAIAGIPDCEYPSETVDCSVAGAVCEAGECTDPDQAAGPSQEGDFVLTEFMAKSMTGTDKGEWVEFYNTTDGPLNLEGCLLRDDGSDSFEITGELLVEGGAYVLFARSDVAEENHGLPAPAMVYTGFQLANSTDEIALQCGELVVDHVGYTSDWVTDFAATQLHPASYDMTLNNDLANWCVATTEYGTATKLGTPGQANIDCL